MRAAGATAPARDRRALIAILGVSAAVAAIAALLGWLLDGGPDFDALVGPLEATYVGSFGATDATPLLQPVGVAVDGSRVFVADARRGSVAVYDAAGRHTGEIGAGQLATPIYVAVSPLDGRLYVSDRTRRAVSMFATDGDYLGDVPAPASAESSAATPTWEPVAIGFGPDGTLLVTDASDGQRVVAVSPSRSEASVIGTSAPPGPTGSALSYANGIVVAGEEVVVADSNNLRLVLISRRTGSVRVVPVAGLPRGIATFRAGARDELAVTDTTGSRLRFYATDGTLQGEVGAGQAEAGGLRLPTGVATGSDGSLFVADTGNRRITQWRVRPRQTSLLAALQALAGTWYAWAASAAVVAGATSVCLLLVERKRTTGSPV